MKTHVYTLLIIAGVALCGCSKDEGAPVTDTSDLGIEDSGVGDDCAPNMLCAVLTGTADGEIIRFSLYEITDETEWPPKEMGFPSWVVMEDITQFEIPLEVRIPDVLEKVKIMSAGRELSGKIALAVVSLPEGGMVPKPGDAVGYSVPIENWQKGQPLDFGTVKLSLIVESPVPGPGWEIHELGEKFINAIYMDLYDLNNDGLLDVVANNNLYMAMDEVVLEDVQDEAMVLAYLMNDNQEIGETIHLATDLPFATGIKAFDDDGEPVIVLGTGARSNSADTTPTYAFTMMSDGWERKPILDQGIDYNSSLVVPCDLDQDGDNDLVIAGKDAYSAPGSWMENQGTDWIPHLRQHAEWSGDVVMHSNAAFACEDMDGDDYPDVVYQPLYTDFTKAEDEQKSGTIIIALNPGNLATAGDTATWEEIMINTDHYMSADMWIADINADGRPDIVSNNLFKNKEVSWYEQPANIDDVWPEYLLADQVNIPGDMYLEDINGDGLNDISVAEVMGKRSFWLENPGAGDAQKSPWTQHDFFTGVGLPGDFVIVDFDKDGDMDYVGVSMIIGKVIYLERVDPY
ncbi:MAG: VCBS repeat-containing protein [Proteobacteria bacterium]|nr:VCBS repeat-containing protein [Pseudomonadota bacterium]